MKSHTVRSNAKRHARNLAAKFPGLFEAGEPHHAPEGKWFPSVTFFDESGLPGSVPAEVSETCIINNPMPGEELVVSFPEDEETVTITKTQAVGLSEFNLSDPAAKSAKLFGIPVITEDNSTLIITRSGRQKIAEAAVAAGLAPPVAILAATLPPRKESSPEEIAARRAERRQRIDAEKVAGIRTASGDKVKINKKQTILDLIGREGGTTQAELETATGWQRHTLRGYIAGTLRKLLAPAGEIKCLREKGVDTRYVFVKYATK